MFFEKIIERNNDKTIVKLCNKLNKSCSFTKSTYMTALCELAYRLFIFGHEEDALLVCEYSNIDIPQKINYNCWDFILFIWGLEAFIYNKNDRRKDKEYRVKEMKKVWSVPKTGGETTEESWNFHKKTAARQKYDDLCCKKKIEQAIEENDKKSETIYRITALYKMIGYGITGYYPAFEDNKDKLSQDIDDYINQIVF